MTTGIAAIIMIIFAPIQALIYLTKGEDAAFGFMSGIAGSFANVLELVLNGN